MKYILLFVAIISCGEERGEEEHFRDRIVIACVCNNPSSIWHLSECNEECTKRDYTGTAHCACITDIQCEENRSTSDFLRRACGIYYR